MEDKITEGQIKIDRLCDKELSWAEIVKNPILQPVAEASPTYESQGLVIQRALSEFDKVKEQISTLMKENPTYQQTIIMSKIRDVLSFSQQIIHSQDIQREVIKRCLNDIIKIVEKYYSKKSSDKSENFETNTGKINEFIRKIEVPSMKDDLKEIEEQEQERKEKEKKKKEIKKMTKEEVEKEIEGFEEEISNQNLEPVEMEITETEEDEDGELTDEAKEKIMEAIEKVKEGKVNNFEDMKKSFDKKKKEKEEKKRGRPKKIKKTSDEN